MFFARIVREFDNGFRPHRRKFDRIYLKYQIPGGGMIAFGIDSYISVY